MANPEHTKQETLSKSHWRAATEFLFTPSKEITEIGQRRQAELVAWLSLILMLWFLLAVVVITLLGRFSFSTVILASVAGISLITYFLSRTSRFLLAARGLVILIVVVSIIFLVAGYSLTNFLAIITLGFVIASAVLPNRELVATVIIGSVLSFSTVIFLPALNQFNFYSTASSATIIGVLLAVFSGLRNSVERERLDELRSVNQSLQAMQATLEDRVTERTFELQERSTDLEKASKAMEQRAIQLQAVALVGKAITSVQGIDDLLPQITQVINEQFGFYHVGIFLLDRNKEYAVLRATNSAGGQTMLERKHKLKVGQAGIVGYVAAIGISRIALDTGADAVFFSNPDLSETHSEMALPLKVGQETIGVLDVQSDKIAAFGDEDKDILSIVADQVSVGIQNALRFQETQQAVAEAESVTRQYLLKEWRQISQENKVPGYQYASGRLVSLEKPVEAPEIQQAIKSGETRRLQEPDFHRLAVPIKLRDRVIGVLNLQSNSRNWKQDELDIAQAIADRVALAVENARLLESFQTQAARERTIGEITAKVGASVNLRNVLQTAVEELGRVLPGSDVVIQIESGKDESN